MTATSKKGNIMCNKISVNKMRAYSCGWKYDPRVILIPEEGYGYKIVKFKNESDWRQ